jgi:C-terminal processing protease CtpA/Prc
LYKRSTLDRFETLSRLEKVDFEKKAQRVYPKGMISKEYDFYKSEMGTIESILYEKKLTNRKSRTFLGNCKLLTNGLSMSASVLMASWFKTHDRGEIIGSPCFGSMAGTHGNPGQVILTNSGLPISISTLKLNTLRGVKGFEVSPDIPIKLGIQDLTEKRDPFKSYY